MDENVFAYSNRSGGERALVVYNNRYGHDARHHRFFRRLRRQGLRPTAPAAAAGKAWASAAIPASSWPGATRSPAWNICAARSELAERGLTLDLHAYQCHVFLDWRELCATPKQPWDRLCDQLNGRGVPNLDDALVNLELRPVHDALRAQLRPGLVRLFADLAEHPRTLAGARPTRRIEVGAQGVL